MPERTRKRSRVRVVPSASLGKFVSHVDYERLKILFRTALAFRDVCDGIDGCGRVSDQLREQFPQEWADFRAALLDVELGAISAALRDES